MANRTNASITKDQSDILVAIGKLETKVDSMTVDIAGARTEIKETNISSAARLLSLESNAITKFEVNSRLEDLEKTMHDLEAGAEKKHDEMWEAIRATTKVSDNNTTTIRFWGTAISALLGLGEVLLKIFH